MYEAQSRKQENAVPQQITVSLGISSKMSLEALEELYSGIKLACNTYNVDFINPGVLP